MRRSRFNTLMSWADALMASSAHAFIAFWTRVERAYKRPSSALACRLKFAFYPLLAIGTLGWLGWDYTHDRSLDSAEDAIFDKVIHWRPIEPKPSGRVVVVEIDDCSIEHFRALGEGGWPWSRQRHADLLDQLDRAGVRAVGYDVLFAEASTQDPVGDATLEAMAEGGKGRFVFGSSRVHPDLDDEPGATPVAQAPGVFKLAPSPHPSPRIALLLPYGKSMATYSALLDITRGADGVIRDIPLRRQFGAWALPSLPLSLAANVTGQAPASFPAAVRVNWRVDSQLPSISAADLLEGKAICRNPRDALPSVKGNVVLVGYNASGINDTKPTPVDAVMPGVELLGEATEALVNDSAIWMPPTWVKYALAAVLLLLVTFAFFRGEPASDVDAVFVATNLLLLLLAFSGLTFFGMFFDIFASIGFVSLYFGLCRMYAGVQRGRAVGNGDFRAEFDPAVDRWLVMARLRFIPYPSLDAAAASRRRREYRRRLRRFLYAGCEAVMVEGIVERKSWLHETLDDLMVLVWKGADDASTRRLAERELDLLHADFNAYDAHLDDDGMVKVCILSAEIDDDRDDSDRGERLRLREVLGHVLDSHDEWPLRARNSFVEAGGGTRMPRVEPPASARPPESEPAGDPACSSPDRR